jgi:hypothetical protein
MTTFYKPTKTTVTVELPDHMSKDDLLKLIEQNSKEKKLSVYILYDRSGSMASRQEEAIMATNAYVKKLDPYVRVTVVAFDSDTPHDVVVNNVLAKDYIPLTVDKIYARGMTPLFDAVGWTIDKMFVDNPDRAILVVQTDGEENYSKEYSYSAVIEKVRTLKNKNYEIVFLGSEFKDVGKVSFNLGIGAASTINRTAGNYLSVSASLAGMTKSYLDTGAAAAWSDEDKKDLGDDS